MIGLCPSLTRGLRAAGGLSFLLLLGLQAVIAAQPTIPRKVASHRLADSNQPPGTLGYLRKLAGGVDGTYFQPVKLIAPHGTRIGAAQDDANCDGQAPALLGLQVGVPYRLRIAHVGFSGGMELYPSVELLDRVYPPEGMETRFAIPIELTDEDLRLASSGQYIVRVIYVEDPDLALPLAESSDSPQRSFDVQDDQDPLAVADVYGRPIAIVRLGSKAPGPDGPDESFLFGSPPLQYLDPGRGAEVPTAARMSRVPQRSPILGNPQLRRNSQ